MIIKKILSPATSIISLFILSLFLNFSSKSDENNIKFYSEDNGILSIMYHRFNEHEYPSTNINKIYINRGPGSFAGIRNSISVVKALKLAKNIDYYCYSLEDFKGEKDVKYENVPYLCNKFKIKKNLINPIYIS